MKITIFGLSITSSWGNGHATTYRSLVRALASRGHEVVFLERNATWYQENRDLPRPPYCRTCLYEDVDEIEGRLLHEITSADLVIVGSYVPDGVRIGDLVLARATGVTAFYDIDTPVTLARIATGIDYLEPRQIGRYDLYLSFTGGPTLNLLRTRYAARHPRALYCSVDPQHYHPDPDVPPEVDLGYLGTYSTDRQPVLDRLLLDPARAWPSGRFVVAGPQYPEGIDWPANVERIQHLAPSRHRDFYTRSRFTLNVTRQDMVQAGFSPSVRLFEAAACGTPIISDEWAGLEAFFTPGSEILVASDGADTLRYLRELPESERIALGKRGLARVLRSHTSAHRARELEGYVAEVTGERTGEVRPMTEMLERSAL